MKQLFLSIRILGVVLAVQQNIYPVWLARIASNFTQCLIIVAGFKNEHLGIYRCVTVNAFYCFLVRTHPLVVAVRVELHRVMISTRPTLVTSASETVLNKCGFTYQKGPCLWVFVRWWDCIHACWQKKKMFFLVLLRYNYVFFLYACLLEI